MPPLEIAGNAAKDSKYRVEYAPFRSEEDAARIRQLDEEFRTRPKINELAHSSEKVNITVGENPELRTIAEKYIERSWQGDLGKNSKMGVENVKYNLKQELREEMKQKLVPGVALLGSASLLVVVGTPAIAAVPALGAFVAGGYLVYRVAKAWNNKNKGLEALKKGSF